MTGCWRAGRRLWRRGVCVAAFRRNWWQLWPTCTGRGGFQHLLLETSGLAHPAPILQTLLAPGVREAYRLGGVVAVVDPLHLDQYLGFPEAKAQIQYADLIVVSKVDHLHGEELIQLERSLKGLNPPGPFKAGGPGGGARLGGGPLTAPGHGVPHPSP